MICAFLRPSSYAFSRARSVSLCIRQFSQEGVTIPADLKDLGRPFERPRIGKVGKNCVPILD